MRSLVVPKQPLYAVRAIYANGPLQVGTSAGSHSPASKATRKQGAARRLDAGDPRQSRKMRRTEHGTHFGQVTIETMRDDTEGFFKCYEWRATLRSVKRTRLAVAAGPVYSVSAATRRRVDTTDLVSAGDELSDMDTMLVHISVGNPMRICGKNNRGVIALQVVFHGWRFVECVEAGEDDGGVTGSQERPGDPTYLWITRCVPARIEGCQRRRLHLIQIRKSARILGVNRGVY